MVVDEDVVVVDEEEVVVEEEEVVVEGEEVVVEEDMWVVVVVVVEDMVMVVVGEGSSVTEQGLGSGSLKAALINTQSLLNRLKTNEEASDAQAES